MSIQMIWSNIIQRAWFSMPSSGYWLTKIHRLIQIKLDVYFQHANCLERNLCQFRVAVLLCPVLVHCMNLDLENSSVSDWFFFCIEVSWWVRFAFYKWFICGYTISKLYTYYSFCLFFLVAFFFFFLVFAWPKIIVKDNNQRIFVWFLISKPIIVILYEKKKHNRYIFS